MSTPFFIVQGATPDDQGLRRHVGADRVSCPPLCSQAVTVVAWLHDLARLVAGMCRHRARLLALGEDLVQLDLSRLYAEVVTVPETGELLVLIREMRVLAVDDNTINRGFLVRLLAGLRATGFTQVSACAFERPAFTKTPISRASL